MKNGNLKIAIFYLNLQIHHL